MKTKRNKGNITIESIELAEKMPEGFEVQKNLEDYAYTI